MNRLCQDLIKCGQNKGISINDPFVTIEEEPHSRYGPAPVRVEKMLELIKQRLPGPPQFLLYILPKRKIFDVYSPWKRKMLVDLGVVTQCIVPMKLNDQYLTNILLKINAKASHGVCD